MKETSIGTSLSRKVGPVVEVKWRQRTLDKKY
jgi:hypothetical protein